MGYFVPSLLLWCSFTDACVLLQSIAAVVQTRTLMTHVPDSTLEKPEFAKDTPVLAETVITGSGATVQNHKQGI